MQRKLYLALFIAAFVPVLVFAAGKIRGKVTDAGTGEPLVGANVVVAGTQMGAATNVSGEFVILNVPAGTYTLRTSFVGYQTITLSNLRVNNDLTTEANFQLPAEGVTVGTIEIVAERPLVNKNATNAVRIIDGEFFEKVPGRGINTAVTTQPGVVYQGGSIYIRGGRADEVGYRLEGVNVANPLYGGRAVSITAEAVEQIQVQAGGFNAEYGGANAGIVQTQLKTGSADAWKFSALGETDRYAKFGKKALGGYTYGYSDYTVTMGGPLPVLDKKVRFFGSMQNTFYRDDALAVQGPIDFTLVTDKVLTAAHSSTSAADTVHLLRDNGNGVGGSDNTWMGTGTLLFDFSPMTVRLAGSYSYNQYRDQTTLANLLNESRLGLNKIKNGFFNVRFSHMLTPTLFYDANFNYFNRITQNMDPDFKTDFWSYGNVAANEALGYHLYSAGTNYGVYSFFNGSISVNQPGTQISGYGITKQQSLGGKLDMTAQLKQHEVKFGGEYNRYKIRRFALGSYEARQYAKLLATYGSKDAIPETSLLLAGDGMEDVYGYDAYGNEIENDVVKNGVLYYYGPRKPVFADGYVQDKIEFSDIILNVGLRWDYINPDSKDTPHPQELSFSSTNLLLDSNLIATEKTSQISPRIGFSFPVTDRTVFHVQYGKFIQQTELRDSYLGSGQISTITSNSGYFVTGAWGWGLKPTRTTQYEAGFSQQVSDFASFDITAFYKDIQDQVSSIYIKPAAGSATQNYLEFINADFTTSKGVEVKFTMRRTNRLSAQVNYTFSDARTTGSNTASSAGVWSAGSTVALPKYTFPADFNQAHRGSISLDYRFAKNDGGPVLEQLGLNLLAQFNSGHNYTLLVDNTESTTDTDIRNRTPIEPIGSSTTPWFFQLDARLDKTFSVGAFDLNAYIYVINLLGTKNATGVYYRTGDPSDDGWLSTSNAQNKIETYGSSYVDFWRAVYDGDNSGNWGPPRQIRFGVKLEY